MFSRIYYNEDGAPEVDPDEVAQHLSNVSIIDVRRPEEYTGELGHIPQSKLLTMGEQLEQTFDEFDDTKTYVFVCRSGARSSAATLRAKSKGCTSCFNLRGGMLRWNALGYDTER